METLRADIVERLRGTASALRQNSDFGLSGIVAEAADEIERQIDLRNHQCKLKLDALAEIERLRKPKRGRFVERGDGVVPVIEDEARIKELEDTLESLKHRCRQLDADLTWALAQIERLRERVHYAEGTADANIARANETEAEIERLQKGGETL